MYRKKHLVVTAVLTAAVVWIFACAFFMGLGGYESGDTLLRARKMITENYVNPLTEEQLTLMNDMAIDAMVYSLGDQYSAYLNESDLTSYQEEHQENYVGIGVSVNFDAAKNEMVVVSPYDGSPAQNAGLLPGDVIVEVGEIVVNAEQFKNAGSFIELDVLC